MSSTILVTGATGTVGQAVVQQLQQQQIVCCVAVRQPERVPALFGNAAFIPRLASAGPIASRPM